MVRITELFRKHWFIASIFAIILASIFFRFINYDSRWGLASDQARDAIVGRYAIENFKFPLIGSFSSAGPFQTGGQWYWFVMLGTFIFHNLLMGPWIFLGLTYIVFVGLMILLGKNLIGRKFGILFGIFSAISTAEITQSTNLTNPSLMSLLSLLSILFAILYVKSKYPKYLFFLGFSVSYGIGVHLQGVPLLFLIALTLLLTGFPSKKGILSLLLGLLLPMIPFLIYEKSHNFFNIKNMSYYYLHDQYNISLDVLGRRWLTYLGVFVPQAWANVLGGFNFMGYASMALVGIVFALKLLNRSISKQWLIIILSLFFSLFVIRYARTPLYYGYIVFLHPFIIAVSGWAIYFAYKYNKIFGIIFFGIIIIGSCYKNYFEIINATNNTARSALGWSNLIVKSYPNDSFAIYDFGDRLSGSSLPLVLYLYNDGKISDAGRRIGMGTSDKADDLIHPRLKGNTSELAIRDLQASSSLELQRARWTFINPKMIYNSIENWQ